MHEQYQPTETIKFFDNHQILELINQLVDNPSVFGNVRNNKLTTKDLNAIERGASLVISTVHYKGSGQFTIGFRCRDKGSLQDTNHTLDTDISEWLYRRRPHDVAQVVRHIRSICITHHKQDLNK